MDQPIAFLLINSFICPDGGAGEEMMVHTKRKGVMLWEEGTVCAE